MNVWRLQCNTSKANIAGYCIEKGIAAMGWSLLEYECDPSELSFETYEDYCELANNYYGKNHILNKFVNELRANDIIWLRHNGIYYCARITEKSKWYFDNSEIARKFDASNTMTNINWIRIGDESEVPGALTTAFIRGQTLQKIHNEGILKYSQVIYDQKANDNLFRYNEEITLDEATFYSLISPSDCEDLLYLWLYNKNNNYVCIPSTNKISTPKYELVILDIKTGKHIYIQVKNGNVDIDADDYASLIEGTQNEIYLLTTRGIVINAEKYNNIHIVDPSQLFEFACDENNQNAIPPNVDFWMQFAGGTMDNLNTKGIMIDTNNDDCEKYMIENNVIAAWGTPMKYIQSFRKNDIALFYKKGYGVIAVGKVLSDDVDIIDNGYETKVEWIVTANILNGEIVSVSPSEIKELLNKNFYFASTRKVPFLSNKECQIIIDSLKGKQAKR